ncbi:hypothetical protein V6N11_060958 [Hibiscus sabdariffa]|uniref:Uncharacterized protein n=1 Tax=Hibiscus sabdariffa TaxID=183260 RepID=A0ABR2QRY2_9ROSI
MLDEIATTKSTFNLLEERPVKNRGERETYSFVKTSDVIGREEDKGNIVKFLMNPTDGEDISVLLIVGIGGGVQSTDMNKEELNKVLQDCGNGKRCFVVLDDIQNEEKRIWSELKDLLCRVTEGVE